MYGITIRDDMTLQYCISGVTNPIENHGCSMILPTAQYKLSIMIPVSGSFEKKSKCTRYVLHF